MNQLGGFPLLTLVICLPLLGAGVTLAVPRDRREAIRWVGLLTAASDLLVALFLVLGWIHDPSVEVQFVDGPWSHVASFGIAYHVGVDGVSVLLILLTVLLVPLAILLSAQSEPGSPRANGVVFWTLILEFGLLGALSALDLLLLTSFWTVSLLAVVGLANQGEASATPRYWLLVLAALAAAGLLVTAIGASVPEGTSSLAALRATSFPWHRQAWLFWASVFACSLTGAAFPLHAWYPKASSAVPVPLRLLVGALMLNLGAYGLVRISIALFPLAAISFAPLLVIGGTVGLIYGAGVALGQQAIRDVLAYWRIAQTGLIVIGIFALQDLGLHGAILHSVASSLALSALLVLASGDDSRATAGERSSRFHRLGVSVAFMSAIGVPGLVGFLGQSLLVMQVLRWVWSASELPKVGRPWDWLWRSLVYGGILLSVGALLRAWRRGAVPARAKPAQRTVLGLVVVILIVALGLRPLPVSDAIGPAVYHVLNQVQEGIQRDLGQLALPQADDGPRSVHAVSPPTGDALPATALESATGPAVAGTR